MKNKTSTSQVTHDELANAIRFLSIDAVEKAKSGHPGLPMGMADVATVLFKDFLKFNPKDPDWHDRDRFILSAVRHFMFKNQGWRSMRGMMKNTSFLVLVVILQPLLYFISLEYFGQIVTIAIPWSILILFLIWMWASGKNPFASYEEE